MFFCFVSLWDGWELPFMRTLSTQRFRHRKSILQIFPHADKSNSLRVSDRIPRVCREKQLSSFRVSRFLHWRSTLTRFRQHDRSMKRTVKDWMRTNCKEAQLESSTLSKTGQHVAGELMNCESRWQPLNWINFKSGGDIFKTSAAKALSSEEVCVTLIWAGIWKAENNSANQSERWWARDEIARKLAKKTTRASHASCTDVGVHTCAARISICSRRVPQVGQFEISGRASTGRSQIPHSIDCKKKTRCYSTA